MSDEEAQPIPVPAADNSSATREQARATADELEARREAALKLRNSGKSYRAIGRELGILATQAFEDVKRALRESHTAEADDCKRLELERLDKIQEGLWPRVVGLNADGTPRDGGVDDFAVDRVLKVMDRRAKLLGIDAP